MNKDGIEIEGLMYDPGKSDIKAGDPIESLLHKSCSIIKDNCKTLLF